MVHLRDRVYPLAPPACIISSWKLLRTNCRNDVFVKRGSLFVMRCALIGSLGQQIIVLLPMLGIYVPFREMSHVKADTHPEPGGP